MIADFLQTMFGSSEGFIAVWEARSRQTRWFANNVHGRARAAEDARKYSTSADIYYGLGLHERPASQGRGKSNDVIGVGCVWADVDFGPDHKNKVPPDQQTAMAIARCACPEPSIVIHSGGGLHCYWLLREPWLFKDDADRLRAAGFIKAFQQHLRSAFEDHGYELDSTADLARVLRLPDTFNHKNGHQRPVKLIWPEGDLADAKRYTLDELDFGGRQACAPAIPARTTAVSMEDRIQRCNAYLAKCPDAESGNGGHNATFRAACECYRFGLDDPSAWTVMQEFNSGKTVGEKWTDDELRHKLMDAKKEVESMGGIGCRLNGSKCQSTELVDETSYVCADDTAYARVKVKDHAEIWPVKSKQFKALLWHRERQKHNRVSDKKLADMLEDAQSQAICHGLNRPVGIRVQEVENKIYIDLCDDLWRVVEISAEGWRILDSAPAWLRRSDGMLPLPVPERGGSISMLRPLLNLPDDEHFALVVAWLLAALNPRSPHPLLCLSGEQGTAKSTMQRMLRALVDPHSAPLRTEPRSDRDLMISAHNSWILSYDNMSKLSPQLSDMLCRICSGTGFTTRKLWSDTDEIVITAARPVMLNGINSLASRPDLLDRCISVQLVPILPRDRKDEATLWREFEVVRPRIFGALLDAVAMGLAERHSVTIDPQYRTRMLDFALWSVACEAGCPWEPGLFLRAYNANQGEGHFIAIENSVVAKGIVDQMQRQPEWEGTCEQLLEELISYGCEPAREGWPRTARALRSQIDRISPNLRSVGIRVEQLPRQAHQRLIRITKRENERKELL